MGDCPEWYELVRASKYLGVAPWELSERPVYWREIALAAENAEASIEAQEEAKADKQLRRSKRSYR